MKSLIPTLFTSWDGLEQEEWIDIKQAIRDITNAKTDIAEKQSIKGSFKHEEKKLKDESAKLLAITRQWVRRPKPTISQQSSLNDLNDLNDQDRVKLRKLYVLIQEGLQNPIRTLHANFDKQLLELCQIKQEIRSSDAYKVKGKPLKSGEHRDLMDIEAYKVQVEGSESGEHRDLMDTDTYKIDEKVSESGEHRDLMDTDAYKVEGKTSESGEHRDLMDADAYKIEEDASESGKYRDLMNVEDVVRDGDKSILETGLFYKERSSLDLKLTNSVANRTATSLVPNFGDIEEL
jgi:hypothetical protein